MELGSKVTALEEEIAVLKGEIKSILQEVRAAVLANENPFATDHYEAPMTHAPAAPAPQPLPEPDPEPATPPQVLQFTPHTEPEEPMPAARTEPHQPAAPPVRLAAAPSRRWSVTSLAALMAWMQDNAARMDASDLDIVLSLARYGGLIDADLETTLNKLAAPLLLSETEKRRAGVSDYLLALRELSALIEEAEDVYRSPGSVRRAG